VEARQLSGGKNGYCEMKVSFGFVSITMVSMNSSNFNSKLTIGNFRNSSVRVWPRLLTSHLASPHSSLAT